MQKHPYHARVHYLYGFYWFARTNWDSAISQEKEAIRIGAGGVVNQVEYKAQDMLNSALGNKVMPLINTANYKEAFEELKKAETPNLFNPDLDSYKGIIYSRQGNPDSALSCFHRFKESNPKDVNNLTNIAISYNQKSMRDSARIYINQALKLEPNNENAKRIDSQLNSH
ncbi:MAG: tetratricopeptide repeat protein [Chitinophagales bacterium]